MRSATITRLIDIRPATLDDLEDLVTLHLETVLVAYRDFFPSDADKPEAVGLADLWRRDLDTAHAVLVATEDRQVIGSVIARIGGDLARLHVHPSRWRTGIGRTLHNAAVANLRAAGYPQAGLWVIDKNQPARSLYESLGWRLDPTQTLAELDVVEVRYVLDLRP